MNFKSGSLNRNIAKVKEFSVDLQQHIYNSGMRFRAAVKQFSVPKFYVRYIMEKSCKTKTITTLPGSGHKPKHSLGLKRKIMSTKITLSCAERYE